MKVVTFKNFYLYNSILVERQSNSKMNIIFSDLDGTLLNSQHKVSIPTISAIQNRLTKGDIFIPVSARMPLAITKVTDPISSELPLISYNGALIINKDKTVAYSCSLDNATVKRIIKIVKSNYPQLVINVYCNYDLWLTENIHNYWTEKEMKAVNCIPKIVDLSNFSFNSPIYKLLIQGPKEVKLELKKRLERSINNINIVNYGEITNSSSNKGYAVKQIIEKYKATSIQSWTFGDSENDITMLNSVENPYVMGNASPSIKKLFHNHTLTNDNNGIAFVLNQIND